MTRTAKIIPLFVLPLLLSACGSVYGGAPSLAMQTQTVSSADLSLERPDLLQVADGTRIHGAVCRSGAQISSGPIDVRVERLDASGHVTAQASSRLPTELGVRDRACAFYDLRAAWTLAPQDTVRICADRGGRARCATSHSAD